MKSKFEKISGILLIILATFFAIIGITAIVGEKDYMGGIGLFVIAIIFASLYVRRKRHIQIERTRQAMDKVIPTLSNEPREKRSEEKNTTKPDEPVIDPVAMPSGATVSVFGDAPLDEIGDSTSPHFGLLQKVAFLHSLRGTHRLTKDGSGYHLYLTYDFDIKDPYGFDKKMIDEGYFKEPTQTEVLESYTNNDLQQLLKQNGLPVSGTKAMLVSRLLDNPEAVKEVKTENLYTLSDKGRQFLSEYNDLTTFIRHKGWELPLDEYMRIREDTNHDFYSTAWDILSHRVADRKEASGSGADYEKMGLILQKTGKRAAALKAYLSAFYIAINGELSLNPFRDFDDKEEIENLKQMILSDISLPVLRNPIRKLSDTYIPDMAYEVAIGINLKYDMLDENYFKRAADAVISDDSYALDEVISSALDEYIMKHARRL